MGLGPKICDLNTQNVKITASKTKKVGFIEYTNKMAVLFTYIFIFYFAPWSGVEESPSFRCRVQWELCGC